MIRLLGMTLLTSAVALSVLAYAQEGAPAKKKNDDREVAPDPRDGEKKKADEEKKEPQEEPAEIVKRLKENYGKVDDQLTEAKEAGKSTQELQQKIIDDLDKLIKQHNDNNCGCPNGGGGGGDNSNSQSKSGSSGGSSSSGQASSKGGPSSSGGQKNQPSGGQSGQQQQTKQNSGGKQGEKKEQANGGAGKDQKEEKDQGKDQAKGGAGKDQKEKDQKDQGKDQAKGGNDDKEKKEKGDGGVGKPPENPPPPRTNLTDVYKDTGMSWGHLPLSERKKMDAYAKDRLLNKYEDILRQYYRTIAESDRGKE